MDRIIRISAASPPTIAHVPMMRGSADELLVGLTVARSARNVMRQLMSDGIPNRRRRHRSASSERAERPAAAASSCSHHRSSATSSRRAARASAGRPRVYR